MRSFLEKVSGHVRARVDRQKAQVPYERLKAEIETARKPHDFRLGFPENRLNIIAEIKFSSPSEGRIRQPEPASGIARMYLENGAAALSILTEPAFFGGDLTFLQEVRLMFPQALLLMKDFLLDPYQILQARMNGADAILLLVALLGRDRLGTMLRIVRESGLTPLVEVHQESELAIALEAGADLIGINNRDLDTLKTSIEVSRRLISMVPENVVAISESALKTRDDLDELRELGFDGFLIGTTFMKVSRPGDALGEMLRGCDSRMVVSARKSKEGKA